MSYSASARKISELSGLGFVKNMLSLVKKMPLIIFQITADTFWLLRIADAVEAFSYHKKTQAKKASESAMLDRKKV